ncbi:MAG TPA: LacI family DNA-binding transcriptional regulator [Anaerolineae bacterium]|nr:LacI family DNA-binding transcriptional regulator [Anaerolineae bacterium]
MQHFKTHPCLPLVHMLNLEQIAKLSGVSRSTASRVINNDPNVSRDTRENVLRVVRLMNYVPNAAARGLARGRTQVLGLVIPARVAALFTDPHFAIFIQGVSAACVGHGHAVMLWLAEPDYERRQIRQISHGGVIDGVIVTSALKDDPLVNELSQSQRPFVVVGRRPHDWQTTSVDVDNSGGARLAVRHLLSLGRQRIAIITGPQDTIAGVDRLTGYLTALHEHGCPIDQSLIVDGGCSEHGGYLAMQQLLLHRPDAVFAASDTMAVGALRAIRDAGLQVPNDIALIGFDDTPLAARADPPLTVIRQPARQLGQLAVELLLEQIDYPETAPQCIVLPTELVVRASCGAALK